VSEEPNVAAFAKHAGMFLQGFKIVNLVEVGVDNGAAIQHDPDMPAERGNFVGVPLADFGGAVFCGNDVVDRAIKLPGFDGGVFGGLVIQDLDFHSAISGVARERSANADAIVAAGLQFEFQAQHEIGELTFREEIAAATLGAINHTIGNAVSGSVLANQGPAVQGFSIK
jgi:hypothetical protein